MTSAYPHWRRAAAASAMFLALCAHGPARSQATSTVAPRAASSAAMPNAPQFPGLPLRRDTAEDTSGLQAFGWLAVLLGGFAVVVLIVARGKRHATPAKLAGVAAPAVTGRTALASNVTVYTLKWGNEELLVGNASGSLTLLARRPCEAGALAGEARAAR